MMSIKKEEDDFEMVVKKITGVLATRYVFGSFEYEDICQEIYCFCLEGFERYDGKRNLYNFLYTHAKNQLHNLQRKHYFRGDCPCKLCSFQENGKTKHKDGKYCATYSNWLAVNSRKSSLANAASYYSTNQVEDDSTSGCDLVDLHDFLDTIEKDIPSELKSIFNRMRDNKHVTNREREKLLIFLKENYND